MPVPELIATGRSDVDSTPLELVADAFLLGRRESRRVVDETLDGAGPEFV